MKDVNTCDSFVQYGTPRTGSTFQFYLLLVILRSLNESRPIHKTHAEVKDPRKCLFVSRVGQSITDKYLRKKKVIHVQEFVHLSQYPEDEVAKVSSLFNLSASKEHQVLVHMRLWMILRQCCGTQSSKAHRKQIHTNITGVFNENTVNCHLYNIHAVEDAILHSTLGKGGNIVIEYQRPPFRKGFCQEEDAKLKSGLDFNPSTAVVHLVDDPDGDAARPRFRSDFSSMGAPFLTR